MLTFYLENSYYHHQTLRYSPLHLQASLTSQTERVSSVQNPNPSTLSHHTSACPGPLFTAGSYQVNVSAIWCLRVVGAETPGPVPAVYSQSHSLLLWQAVELYRDGQGSPPNQT